MYGHTAHLAAAVAERARDVRGTDGVIKRVPELMPREVAEKAGAVADTAIDVASPDELTEYDAMVQRKFALMLGPQLAGQCLC